jgi:hypothetical protein
MVINATITTATITDFATIEKCHFFYEILFSIKAACLQMSENISI